MDQEMMESGAPNALQSGTARMMQAAGGMNVGAVAIESERAVAEARGQMQLAKMFPRDINAAYNELMEACKLPALAQVAFFTVPRGGSKVSGPSIRLAEEIARVWGNIEYGHRELSRTDGKSEVEVYAWDKQTNTRSTRQLTVVHVMDTKDGPRKLRDQKDVDDKISNVASKQLRGRILAIMPKWLVQGAIEQCKSTLAGNTAEPLSARARKMTQAFANFGVNLGMIERHLGHKVEDINLDELANLQGIFTAIREGGKVADYFNPEPALPEDKAQDPVTAAIRGRQQAEAPKGEATPQERTARGARAQQAPRREAPAAEQSQQDGGAEERQQAQPAAREEPPAQSRRPRAAEPPPAADPPADDPPADEQDDPPARSEEPPPPSDDDIF